jgi:multidrug resistance protein
MSTDRHETEMGTEAAIDDEGAAAVADDLEPTSTSTQISPEPNASNDAGGNENDTADVEEEAARPETPLHSVFSARQKRFICAMASMGSFFSPLSNFIYLPALTTLSRELRVSNASINLTVTSYQIFQGLAPMFFGDLADAGGRRPVYIICFTIYLGANLGLALQNSYTALFVFRALQSTGSSGTIALGNGVMADIVTSAERGKYIGWVQAGIMVGPALGPTIGGLLSEFLGWRAIFWFLVITAGTYLAAYVILVPETGRNVVGNGSIRPPPLNMSLLDYMKKWKAAKSGIEEEGAQAKAELANKRKLRFPNPLNSLRIVVEKDVAVVLFFASLMVTIFYCMMVEIPSFFQNIYGFNDLQIGLCYMCVTFSPLYHYSC